jgi:hypothetical protein
VCKRADANLHYKLRTVVGVVDFESFSYIVCIVNIHLTNVDNAA